MARGADQLKLHVATGGLFGVSKRLFDCNAIGGIKCVKHGLLLIIIKIFNQINNIVTIKIAHSMCQFTRCKPVDDLFAQAFIKL